MGGQTTPLPSLSSLTSATVPCMPREQLLIPVSTSSTTSTVPILMRPPLRRPRLSAFAFGSFPRNGNLVFILAGARRNLTFISIRYPMTSSCHPSLRPCVHCADDVIVREGPTCHTHTHPEFQISDSAIGTNPPTKNGSPCSAYSITAYSTVSHTCHHRGHSSSFSE